MAFFGDVVIMYIWLMDLISYKETQRRPRKSRSRTPIKLKFQEKGEERKLPKRISTKLNQVD